MTQEAQTAPSLPTPASERGRGPAIAATYSGYTTRPDGKTAWLTLTIPSPTEPESPNSRPVPDQAGHNWPNVGCPA